MARVKIEHRLGIAAPAHEIWKLVGDLPGWKHWNPLYTSAEGTLGFGAPLTLTLALPGRKPQVIRPIVESWTPDELIHWRLSMLGGMVRSVRYIEIEKLTDTGCIFSNGEIFDGLLGPTVARSMRGTIRSGFAAMGEAVKARVEAAWQGREGQPT
ncbi:SRPBCC family protein [Caulobacter sp. KR2-114]|uniref:SRPBCC family protein n=1 Tax=Caulobacter sp. KR2-114 TaxID=3400912 RepID=UPI003C0B7B3D